MTSRATSMDGSSARPRAIAGLLRWDRPRTVGVAALLAVALALPIAVRGDYSRNLLVLSMIYGIAAISLNIIMGLMGQFSFGHAALWGIGGYVSGRLSLQLGVSPWLGILAATVAAAILGVLVGAIALRKTRGLELAIVTLGFGAIAWILALRWQWFGGGMSGVSGIPNVELFGFSLDSTLRFYFFALAVLVGVLAVVRAFERARVGRAVVSVRENEPLAASIGVSPFAHYLAAFGLASGLAGLSGALYAHYYGFLNPSMLSLPIMIMFLMMVLIGGTGHLWGPVLGAVVYVWLTDILSFNQELQLLFFGALVVAAIRFMPDGLSAVLMGAIGRVRRTAARGGEAETTSLTEPATSNVAVPAALSPERADATSIEMGTDEGDGPLLKTEQLRMEFGGLVAVADLDLSIAEGEIVGLIGPNGSGKTTTINMLSGFLAPTAGRVMFRGSDVTRKSPHEIAKQGLIRTFQLSNVYAQLSVRDNVVHSSHLLLQRNGHHSSDEYAMEILSFVGLAHRARASAGELSAGERRYLEIANALAARPVALLLDEPASGLNAEEAARLGDLVRSVRGAGTTVVIVEHNMRVIMSLCDRIVVLDQGQFLAAGRPDEISRDERVVGAYLGRSGSAHSED